ncbi:MAG: hypothetical protein ACYDAM_08575 [Leptospirales bacterium]
MALPMKTVREALDFVTPEITQTLLSDELVKLTGGSRGHSRSGREQIVQEAIPRPANLYVIKSHPVLVFRPIRQF